MSKSYSDETKAAVLAALLGGQAVGKVADDYKIPVGTVKSWKSRTMNGESVATVATEKKSEIGDLLYQYLKVSLVALRSQAELFGDKEWLKKQPAADTALLHGIQTDKAIRLLEAFGKSDDSDTDAED